ncbi:MAG: c-type cytochrome [Verrucomicrobiales bacterium]|nr:c-type cytochrome [Verrucomicrobiales bacterium]
MTKMTFTILAMGVVGLTGVVQAAPQWLWSGKLNTAKANEVVYLRKGFELGGTVKKASLFATCDNVMEVWVNGKKVAENSEWASPVKVDVQKLLKGGKNLIAVRGANDGGSAAGFVAKLEVELADGKKVVVESDASWKLSGEAGSGWQGEGFNDAGWKPAVAMVALGGGPWGGLGSGSVPSKGEIAVKEGFEVEMIYRVPKQEQGSWVALTVLPDGRLVASDQGKQGMYTIDLGSSEPVVKKVPVDLSGAQGLVWAFDRLYVNVNGGRFYQVRDTDGDGELDKVDQLGGANGGGEHGNHAVIVTEDGKNLYVDAGNHTNLPEGITGQRVLNWQEDLLLPRQWDARGHARGRLAPGGWIAKVSPDSKQWEIFSMGYRNQYDIALNRHGDMFTFDADMEWDLGSPWYRPTRICFAASGSDYGWRSGTGKWPTYYEDSLPPVVDIGPGSPTGVASGLGAKFPVKYQDAIYALDWTFGTIWAIHLNEQGAGYVGEREEFVSGSPLPVTDAVVGKDGAFYFTTGGRGTQSALYRVKYVGGEATSPVRVTGSSAGARDRGVRRSLEAFHGKRDAKAVELALGHLASPDRFLRHAARVALEWQPTDWWAEKVLRESRPQARVAGAVALARADGEKRRDVIVGSLLELDAGSLEKGVALGMLRGYALAFIRGGGAPEGALRERVIGQLDPLFPAGDDDALNTELLRVLVYLDAPGVVDKGMALVTSGRSQDEPDWGTVIERNGGYGGTVGKMLADMPPVRELEFAFLLRNVKFGWSLAQREGYFRFLQAAAGKPGGASYKGFLENIKKDALANCSASERVALKGVTGEDLAAPEVFVAKPPRGPGRTWTVAEASQVAAEGLKGRNFENGRNLFHATACAACHLFNGEGGAVGPDLSTVRNKFSVGDLMESLIEPSKVISDQYGSSVVTLKDGKVLMGLVVEREGGAMDVCSIDPKAAPVRVKSGEVAKVEESPVSQMPPGLVNTLSEGELLDLVAYLMSRGNAGDAMFK